MGENNKMKTDFRRSFYFSLIGIWLGLFLSACNVIAYMNEDPFYTDGGDFDLARFPLIKPYEAKRLVDFDDGWWISFQLPPEERNIGYGSIPNVTKIAVENEIILAYTPNTKLHPKTGEVYLHWFVIIPKEKIETGFEKENDFQDYIQQYGIESPNWLDPTDLFHQFDLTWCLDWIPACQ
jgi:hypothetical protein